jgi:predicted phage replisome organizer
LSDNKKYYYLKLKDNYFDQDNIKVLESLPNGHLYSLIILKLYLKACKYNGHLKMTDSIPYDPEKIGILSNVIGHDRDNVEKALNAAFSLGLITKLESGEMWMTEIQNYIGESSTEGDRKRKYRAMLKGELIPIGQMSGQSSDIHPPEIEIDIEKDIKKDIKINNESFETFWKLYDKKTSKPKSEKLWNKIDIKLFGSIYEHVTAYVKSTPDKKFRKNPDTYLRNECWNDEIIVKDKQTDTPKKLRSVEEILAEGKAKGEI